MRKMILPAVTLFLAAFPGHALVRVDPMEYGIRLQPGRASVPEPAPAARFGIRTAPSANAITAWQRTTRTPFQLHLDPVTGAPRMLSGGRSRPYGGSPVEAARAFLRDAQPILGLPAAPDVLAPPTVIPHDWGNQVTFQQQLGGLPVLDHAVTVNITNGGVVVLANNSTEPLERVNLTPAVSALRVAAMARGTMTSAPTLAIQATSQAPRLVWRFVEKAASGVPVRVTVDANTAAELKRVPLANFVNGQGLVYRGNPVSTPTRETLPLTFLNGDGTLTGSYSRIFLFATTGSDFTPKQTAVNSGLNFNFGPGTDELSQTQAYYGISHIHDWFKTTFNFTGRDLQLPGFVRDPSMANAYFSPDTSFDGVPTPNGYMDFGFAGASGYPIRDFALDTDVLYHEFTHAVVDKASPTFALQSYGDAERGGINEGTADYFSSSILDDPVLGEYAGQAYGQPYVRDLKSRDHYPEEVWLKGSLLLNGTTFNDVRVYPEVHQTGSIWGPVLWDMRVVLGRQKADALVFKGLTLLDGSTTFQSALTAILTADDLLYSGVDRPQITDVFGKRGITESVYPIKYQPYDAFYSDSTASSASKILIGLPYKGSDGYAYITDYELFPSYNVGDSYLLAGYVDDPTIKTVALVLKDSSKAVVGKITAAVKPMQAKDSNGTNTTFYYFNQDGSFPASLIPSGQTSLTGLKLYINSYTQTKTNVDTYFSTTTPKAIAPTNPVSVAAQLVLAQVTPPINPPAFGDTDGNGKVNLADALLVTRYLTGKGTLTNDAKTRADVAAPLDGNPNLADARAILQRAGGLL